MTQLWRLWRQSSQSVASFDYSGTKVSEDDYNENLKDVVETYDTILTQCSLDEMLQIVKSVYGALDKRPGSCRLKG